MPLPDQVLHEPALPAVSVRVVQLKLALDVPLGVAHVTVSVLVVAAFALVPAVPVGTPANEYAPENVPKVEQR